MPITTDHIRATLAAYADTYPEDRQRLSVVHQLLDDGADVTSRKEFRGHVTAGAVLVDGRGRVLFVRHLALDRWLTPGGHVEPEDTDLRGAALRELAEETGIRHGVGSVLPGPVHIDVHPIPANPSKNEPAHQHVDFRFLFRLDADTEVTLQPEEVGEFAWLAPDTLTDDHLRARVRSLFAG